MTYKKNSGPKKFPTRFAHYYVTKNGEVWQKYTNSGNNKYASWKKGEFKKMTTYLRGNSKGAEYLYPSVNISLKENGRTVKQIKYYVHRLIAETLIPNPHGLAEIDHIDRDKHNNNVCNLRWVTREENQSAYSHKVPLIKNR